MPINIVPKTEEEKKIYEGARSKFIKKYVPESTDNSPIPQKYLDYADQEGKEAVDKVKKGKKSGGAIKMKVGGSVDENKLMKKEGRGMAKATMQKVASKAVKAHEGRMHKAKSGGSVSKRADGIAIRGKTRGKTV